jgi:hypothetical protein
MSVDHKNRIVCPSSLLRAIRTAFVFPAFLGGVGCMTPSAPAHKVEVVAPVADATIVQSGKVVVMSHRWMDVYYTTPYAADPNLEISDHWGNCMVVIKSPTRFRVLNNSGSDLTVDWKARGIKAPPATTAVLGPPQSQPVATISAPPSSQAITPVAAPPATAQPASIGGLPAEPVPVAAPR